MGKTENCFYYINKIITAALTVTLVLICSSNVWSQSSSDNNIENPKVAQVIDEAAKDNPELAEVLAQIYHSTKKYQDVNAAVGDGYIRDPMNICETASMMGEPSFLGAMGIHYFRPDMIGVTETSPRINGNGLHTDFINPAILIYEPQEDGSLKLVAVENLVFQKGWHAAGNEKRPEFMGYQYFAMADNKETESDEAHMFEPHYDLHMWLYRPNPNGLFMPFNQSVSCKNHSG